MIINLSPQRSDEVLTVTKSGDVLTLNGDEFDFSTLPEGGTIPDGAVPNGFFVGPIERVDGEIHLTLKLPHGPNPEPWQAFPDRLIDVPDGDVDLPAATVTAVETTIRTTTTRWHQTPVVEVETFAETR